MVKVFLDELPKYTTGTYKGKINWIDSAGTNINFQYSDDENSFCGTLLVLDYNKESRKVKIEYDGKVSEIRTCDLRDGTIKKIIGATFKTTAGRFADFKINIGDTLVDYNRNLTILDRKRINTQKYHYKKMYNYQCNICGYNTGWMEECDMLHHKTGCSCCAGKTVVEGINDIPTTDPWMIPYFQGGYDEAKQYTSTCSKKINPICPVCGKVKNNKITISTIKMRHSIGCTCRDGISYPEKFFMSFLDQLRIKYVYQLSKTTFEWIGKYFYDFYLTDYNCIIETHGGQHYKDITWSSSSETNNNDQYKMDLALKNGILNYIQIDCRESTMSFISSSILKSHLFNILNIDSEIVDWNKCAEFACGNITKDICDFYENNNHNIDITSKRFHLSKTGIRRYLKLGSELNWCKFPYHTDRKVLVFKDNLYLGMYPSTKYIEEISLNKFNIYLGQTQIIHNCNKNKLSTNTKYKGSSFVFEPDYIENYKNI